MTGCLSERDVERYHRDGYLSPLRAFSAERAQQLMEQYEACRARQGAIADVVNRIKPHLVCPWLYDLVCDPAVLAPVQSILGPNLLIWGTSFFPKAAHDPAYVSWHQDSNYWGLEPHEIVTAWLALTPSRRENGCMRVLSGSHVEGPLAHRDTFAEHNMLSRGQAVAEAMDESRMVDLELAPGEMSLHHVAIAHGSEANTSSIPRLGFAIRYMATHVRQIGARTCATLAAGVDEHGHFDHEPRPQSEFDPADIAYREEALARLGPVLYDGAEDAGGKARLGTTVAE